MLSLEAVAALRTAATRFDAGSAAAKRAHLTRCAACELDEPRALLAYHDCLLFLCAYPSTPALLAAAESELARVAKAAGALAARGGRPARSLAGSGIAWSSVTVQFSLGLARWLVERHPRHGEIDGFAPGGRSLESVLRFSMPAIEEAALASDSGDPDVALSSLSEGWSGTRLAWLVRELDRLPCAEPMREAMWESLRPFVSIRPEGSALSRTFVRGLPEPAFLHDRELVRRFDTMAVVDEPLPPPRRLSPRQRAHLVDAARAMLAMLGRETDPITLCTPGGVACLELGRGASLALYPMPPSRRAMLDSHVGFVLFRNGLPVAYGGGWPFLGLCRIGVNIFEPYRGGESAWVFCQVLRVYRRLFGAQRFLVEPYQFGAGNPEGLRSGAFWFYYRLGFRPVKPQLSKLAAEEFARMQADRAYRSPLPVLRRLAGSDVELLLPGCDPASAHCEPSDLSRAVSAWIAREHGGDRGAALSASIARVGRALGASARERARWPVGQREAFEALCPLMALVPGLARWSAADRRRTLALMRAKGAEAGLAWFAHVRTHPRWRQAMVRIATDAR